MQGATTEQAADPKATQGDTVADNGSPQSEQDTRSETGDPDALVEDQPNQAKTGTDAAAAVATESTTPGAEEHSNDTPTAKTGGGEEQDKPGKGLRSRQPTKVPACAPV